MTPLGSPARMIIFIRARTFPALFSLTQFPNILVQIIAIYTLNLYLFPSVQLIEFKVQRMSEEQRIIW